MAFQSGTATSPNDLLDKVRLFATGSCGYTQLMYQPDYSYDPSYYRLHLQHPSGQIVNIRPLYNTIIQFYGSTGWDSNADWIGQAVASEILSVNLMSGGAEYFLFGGDGWLYCVVQRGNNAYSMMAFGAIEKTCTFNGGAFLSSLEVDCVRADIDGYTNNWMTGGVYRTYNPGLKMFEQSITRPLDDYSPIVYNGVTPLYPCTVEIRRPDNFYSLVGYAPGIRLLNMDRKYVNKDVITVGSDEYVVFAVSSSSYVSNGYAFLK